MSNIAFWRKILSSTSAPSQDIEQYLGPIYRSEARFVVALLSKEFPKKIWTKFESDNFKQRFGEGSVIPIWFNDSPPGMFDESAALGGFVFDPKGDVGMQINWICDLLVRRAGDERQAEEEATKARDQSKDTEEVA